MPQRSLGAGRAETAERCLGGAGRAQAESWGHHWDPRGRQAAPPDPTNCKDRGSRAKAQPLVAKGQERVTVT